MSCNCGLADNKSPETLVAALFFMMTRYASGQDSHLVQPIIDHFDWLSKHPDLVNTSLQLTCRRLQKSWLLQSAKLNSEQVSSQSLH